MARVPYRSSRKRRDDGTDKFFLYVAFHSVWTAVADLFRD